MYKSDWCKILKNSHFVDRIFLLSFFCDLSVTLHYLHYMSQQCHEELVLPIAQEAVCVQSILMTIKAQLHQIVFVLNFFLSSKCYLSGRATQIESSHCRSAGAEPVPLKAILQRNSHKNLASSNVCISVLEKYLQIKLMPYWIYKAIFRKLAIQTLS